MSTQRIVDRNKKRQWNIKWQISACKSDGKGCLNVRWDFMELMDRRTITFEYGNKKYKAFHESGIIKQITNDGKFTIQLQLNYGDVIIWGENNWFCTCKQDGIVNEDIVNMSLYVESKTNTKKKQPLQQHFQRSKYDYPHNMPMVQNVHNQCNNAGSQMCVTQDNWESDNKNETKTNSEYAEYNEDVVEPSGSDDYFIKRELMQKNGKKMVHITKPLCKGDVIYGPGGSKQLWIVSKRHILRQTYLDHEHVRDDVRMQSHDVFYVQEELHYACRYMNKYARITKYMSPVTIFMEFKSTRNIEIKNKTDNYSEDEYEYAEDKEIIKLMNT